MITLELVKDSDTVHLYGKRCYLIDKFGFVVRIDCDEAIPVTSLALELRDLAESEDDHA